MRGEHLVDGCGEIRCGCANRVAPMSTKTKAPRHHFKGIKKHDVQSNPTRAHDPTKTHKRTPATIRRLNMYSAKPHRNRQGEILSGQYVSKEVRAKKAHLWPVSRLQRDAEASLGPR